MNVNNLLIGSPDPPRLAESDARLFGKPTYEDESYSTWQIGSGFVSVGPHDQVFGKNAHPGRLIWNIETTDVQGEFERMKAAGAIVIRDPYGFDEAPGALIATLADPDDNYFQLMTPMPETTPA